MNRPLTSRIIVHHSVTPQEWEKEHTLSVIESAHKKRGLLAGQGRAAYHVVIGKDWQALTRPADSIGYHTGSFTLAPQWLRNRLPRSIRNISYSNLTGVAVCLVGNFNNDTLTDYQEQKLADQLNNWLNQYNLKENAIYLHRDLKATACPGANITSGFVKSLLVKPEEKLNVRELFVDIWKVPPARGDELYFITRFAQGKVGSRQEMIDDMTGWYKRVYPRGKFSESGNAVWQKEKEKVLNGG